MFGTHEKRTSYAAACANKSAFFPCASVNNYVAMAISAIALFVFSAIRLINIISMIIISVIIGIVVIDKSEYDRGKLQLA